MKSFIALMLSMFLVLAIMLTMAFMAIADPGTAAATAPAASQPDPSIVAWFSLYKAYIFAAALALSELLAVTPWFKGNGLLDTVIKGLKMLSGKGETQ